MTKEYLNKNSNELFWLFWLGIPYLIWMYSINIELSKNIPNYSKYNRFLIYGLVTFTICYFLATPVLLIFGLTNVNIIMPFHFTAIGCVFLMMIMSASTIVRFQKEEELKQSNFLILFFGIWYFVIGIWKIQPKLNKYIKRIIT